ncbi:cobalt-precorrin-6A reductase [Methyloligella solikamskensis]|uniref:Cobalt-precorrin-6A reductase n=1 Tax=Methyloligella solikamskensis TaxID=1177756 RepID=A0ABW3J7S9_9HYPH
MRILILGGTTEASGLAKQLAGDARFSPILSLAGRTASPAAQPVPCRIGGFGGVEGLAAWLKHEGVDVLVDATHPFSTGISANAVAAAEATGVPLLTLVRPGWEAQPGDRWIDVNTLEEAASALGETPLRVLLTIGRQEIAAFKAAPQHHYLIRSIDPPVPDDLPTDAELLLRRGPFSEEDELTLFRDAGVETIVSKNAGGAATYAKLVAARALGLPVVMVARPEKPGGHRVETVEAAFAWLEARLSDHRGAPSERGV